MAYSVHHVPGRIRYKFPGLTRDQIYAVGRALGQCHDVEHVDVRAASCSLVIHYNPAHTHIHRLTGCIQSVLNAVPDFEAAAMPTQARPLMGLSDEMMIRSVRHVGMVFGKTAFKVALEQAVRGGLNSLYRSVLARG